MPAESSPTDLEAIGGPIAAALVPGWAVTFEWSSPEELDALIPGALALCEPLPTRSMARVRVRSPWPTGESLDETLWHELTHAAWSPLTALIPRSGAAMMLQEQIVERFGVLLSKLSPALARVVAKAIGGCASPQVFARLAPLARTTEPRDDEEDDDEEEDARLARGGGQMDAQQVLEALKNADGEAALKILEDYVAGIVKEAMGDAAPESQPGDALGQLPADPKAAPAPAAPMGRRPMLFARTIHALAGGATMDESEGAVRAALQNSREQPGLLAAVARLEAAEKTRAAADADAALRATLASAVRARKYDRAELFDVGQGADSKETLTPKAWAREMSGSALAAMIAGKLARASSAGPGGGPLVPDDSTPHVSAGVADYCARRGITDPVRIAALQAAHHSDAVAPTTELR